MNLKKIRRMGDTESDAALWNIWMEDKIMALSNLFGWNKKAEEAPATACGTACGAGDQPEEKPAACGTACGAGDK